MRRPSPPRARAAPRPASARPTPTPGPGSRTPPDPGARPEDPRAQDRPPPALVQLPPRGPHPRPRPGDSPLRPAAVTGTLLPSHPSGSCPRSSPGGCGAAGTLGLPVGSGPCPRGHLPKRAPGAAGEWPSASARDRGRSLRPARPASRLGVPRRQTKAAGRVRGPPVSCTRGGGHGESPGRRSEASASLGALCDDAALANRLLWVWPLGCSAAAPGAGSPRRVGSSAWSSGSGVHVAHPSSAQGTWT